MVDVEQVSVAVTGFTVALSVAHELIPVSAAPVIIQVSTDLQLEVRDD